MLEWRIRLVLPSLALMLSFGITAAKADVIAVVSAKSAVSVLSKTQVSDIFLGKRTRFPDGTPAVPIDQVEGAAARDEFHAKVANMSPPQVKAFWWRMTFTGRGQSPRSVSNNLEVKKLLLDNPNAIGYVEPSVLRP
jgi:ABC-type phosphate transport system substrate-binding protein